MNIRTEKPEPVEITEIRLTRHSKGYAIIRERYEKILADLRNSLEFEQVESQTVKLRAKIDIIKTVIGLPDEIEREWRNKT